MMMQNMGLNRWVLAAAVAALVSGLSTNVAAQDQTRDQTRDQTQDQTRDRERLQDPIFGSQLMTQQERNVYRNRMRALNTEQEREALRLEHHQQMQERARAQGMTLPDMPPAGGMGAGPGPAAGPGAGMGGGSGMGGGGGMGGGMGGGAGPGGKK